MHVAVVHTTCGSYIDPNCIHCVVVGEDLPQLYEKLASQGVVCEIENGWVLTSPDRDSTSVTVEFFEEND